MSAPSTLSAPEAATEAATVVALGGGDTSGPALEGVNLAPYVRGHAGELAALLNRLGPFTSRSEVEADPEAAALLAA